ncbi:response regulator [Paenibacillus sp. J2TS4]|uniref:response regulator n=1 Tax=Paenibacillus sp. J2TS4 TaxID=2807194 RepID=UPI001B19355F|nr:response regulator [Paenibacillus sp. J2TS4]GIP31547.1 AraC family transcriptional regulator [Paenibacillus sp. J2TS4]
MNLMIVEDEARLRNSLANNIPWEEHGIDVVGLAANGKEALELIDRKKPDILLVDIQMPEMDGLTLARLVHDKDPYTQFVILSGHDNFAFAQSALELGVCKYLLKPAGDTEILEAILEAAEKVRREMEKRHNQQQLQLKWSQHLPYAREMFLQYWLTGKYVEWEIKEKGRDLLPGLQMNQQYIVAVVDMDPLPEEEKRFKDSDSQLLDFSVKSVALEFLERTPCWICSDSAGATAIIFTSSPAEDGSDFLLNVNTLVVKLLFVIKECLKLTASAGISKPTLDKESVSKLYEQARKALQERIVYGNDLAVPYRGESLKEPVLPAEPNIEKELEIALEISDSNKAMMALDLIWQQGMFKAGSVEEMQENVLYLSSLFIRFVHKQGWLLQEVVGNDFAYYRNTQGLTSKDQIYEWMRRFVKSFISYQQTQRKTTSHKMVREILTIVENEMDQELTLHTVADRLFVNSSYLSRLFKQETGKSFSAHVLERKMESAKGYLLEGAKVYDAARMVGYRDVSYFTRVFRKYWGVTPGEVKGG